ncbi:site-2 protease family protein [bacterium]|nr:MAG: site-2 protease family protein [bacterium]
MQNKKKKPKIWINIVLLVITIITTTLAGAIMEPTEEFTFRWLLNGFRFSVPLILILGCHECGHYIASRMHNVDATLPYFIPAPTLIGTFGAFIKIKEPIETRRSLMDIGAAGPLMGFIIALPILIWGVAISKVVPISDDLAGIRLGSSLILTIVSKLIHGNIPAGYDLYLSPPAFAGWLGLFVTSLNLLPIGQLDGGHISYALWGKTAHKLSKIVFFTLLPLGLLWLGWIFWALLLWFALGVKHPPIVNPEKYLDSKRIIIGYVCIVIFVITFTPVPFSW